MTDRNFYQYGTAVGEVTFEGLDPEMELRMVPLPSQTAWDQATVRAGALFGLTAPALLNAATMRKLSSDVGAKVGETLQTVRDLAQELREAHVRASVEPDDSDRLQVAVEVNSLLASLQQAAEGKTVETLAQAVLTAAPVHQGKTVSSAAEVLRALRLVNWEDLQSATALPDPFGRQATDLLSQAQQALKTHELSSPLQSSLPAIQRQLGQLHDRQRQAQQDEIEKQRQALEDERRRLEEERRRLEETRNREQAKEDEEEEEEGVTEVAGDTFELTTAIKDIDQKLDEIRGRVRRQPKDSTVQIRVRVFGKKK